MEEQGKLLVAFRENTEDMVLASVVGQREYWMTAHCLRALHKG